MKKKVLIIAIIAAIALIAIAGATIAYFTDTDENTNVITMGNVKIKLDEAKVKYDPDTYEFTAGNKRVKENNYENVYPGAVLPKDPTVHNVGSMDAYVRVKVSITYNAIVTLFQDDPDAPLAYILDPQTCAEALIGELGDNWEIVACDFDGAINDDDCKLVLTINYNEILASETDTTAVFANVTIPAFAEHAIVGDFDIDVLAEGVQAKGFDSVAAAFAATFDAE